MRHNNQIFTRGERRAFGLVLLASVVLTLSMVALEPAFRSSLGAYDAAQAAPSLPNVIDAQPVAAS